MSEGSLQFFFFALMVHDFTILRVCMFSDLSVSELKLFYFVYFCFFKMVAKSARLFKVLPSILANP